MSSYNYLKKEGLDHQFHPSYTRMAPAHYITKIELLGCPDPNPVYERFFKPERNKYSSSDTPAKIGEHYIGTLYEEIKNGSSSVQKQVLLALLFLPELTAGLIFLLTYMHSENLAKVRQD